MTSELTLMLYATITGFVAAGVIGSFYQWVTDQPPRFMTDVEGALGMLCVSLLCAVTGPLIIMRNAIRGRRIEQRPIGWLAASSVIALGWSTCSGILMLYVIVSLRHSLV